MNKAGTALMGLGKAKGKNRAAEAARAAIESPLLDFPVTDAKGIVFNIIGDADLTLAEINEAASVIYANVDPDANIIFGALVDTDVASECPLTRRSPPKLCQRACLCFAPVHDEFEPQHTQTHCADLGKRLEFSQRVRSNVVSRFEGRWCAETVGMCLARASPKDLSNLIPNPNLTPWISGFSQSSLPR
ncbi:unnamed protein product [Ectocarpus sp. 4 AP-2014]